MYSNISINEIVRLLCTKVQISPLSSPVCAVFENLCLVTEIPTWYFIFIYPFEGLFSLILTFVKYTYTPCHSLTAAAVLCYTNMRLVISVLDLKAVRSELTVESLKYFEKPNEKNRLHSKQEGWIPFPSCQCLFPVSYILTGDWGLESQWDTLKSIFTKQVCISHQ